MTSTLEQFTRPNLLTLILVGALLVTLAAPLAHDIWYVWRSWVDERKRNGKDRKND